MGHVDAGHEILCVLQGLRLQEREGEWERELEGRERGSERERTFGRWDMSMPAMKSSIIFRVWDCRRERGSERERGEGRERWSERKRTLGRWDMSMPAMKSSMFCRVWNCRRERGRERKRGRERERKREREREGSREREGEWERAYLGEVGHVNTGHEVFCVLQGLLC